MKNNYIIFIILVFLLNSCSGFKLKRSDRADEFLIEKKNPLIMPPDINDLPKPKENMGEEEGSNEDFKEVLAKENNKKINDNSSTTSSSLKESIIKKIEQ